MSFLAQEFYRVISHVKVKLISNVSKTVSCQHHQALTMSNESIIISCPDDGNSP
jgi:hypothetical protein